MKTFKTPKGTELPLLDLRGKPYLQVAHRMVWFREEFPLGRIDTQCVEKGDTYAIYRATISIPDASGNYIKLADADKREDKQHFSDFMEKAQTSAIGRALAMCGFGTQFAPDIEEGDRLADSPTDHLKKGAPPQREPGDDDIAVGVFEEKPDTRRQQAQNKATPKQVGLIHAKAKAAGMDEEMYRAFLFANAGVTSTKDIPFASVNHVLAKIDEHAKRLKNAASNQ